LTCYCCLWLPAVALPCTFRCHCGRHTYSRSSMSQLSVTCVLLLGVTHLFPYVGFGIEPLIKLLTAWPSSSSLTMPSFRPTVMMWRSHASRSLRHPSRFRAHIHHLPPLVCRASTESAVPQCCGTVLWEQLPQRCGVSIRIFAERGRRPSPRPPHRILSTNRRVLQGLPEAHAARPTAGG
jgi:hypothetical protein